MSFPSADTETPIKKSAIAFTHGTGPNFACINGIVQCSRDDTRNIAEIVRDGIMGRPSLWRAREA